MHSLELISNIINTDLHFLNVLRFYLIKGAHDGEIMYI
jgi:hypothetical protein